MSAVSRNLVCYRLFAILCLIVSSASESAAWGDSCQLDSSLLQKRIYEHEIENVIEAFSKCVILQAAIFDDITARSSEPNGTKDSRIEPMVTWAQSFHETLSNNYIELKKLRVHNQGPTSSSTLHTVEDVNDYLSRIDSLSKAISRQIGIGNSLTKIPNAINKHPSIILADAFSFGTVSELERPVLTATLRNDGERTVHVTDVIRTCVCANLELSTTNLPPGGTAEVRCTLDPNVFSGPFLKTFFIKTDDPATPSITVPIRGTVRPLWTVEPDKWHQMRAGDTNAVLRVKAAPDAPALVRTEILGPDGASFELRPAGEREFDAVFTPGDQPRGQHHWTVNLYPEGAETPALGLHLGKQVGEHWKCVPARLRAPVNGRDFVADLLVKPADGKDLPADVDPDAITLSPVWDHVSIEPLGPPTWRGIPLRLTVGAEMVSSWEFPKTFYLTVPNHGVASVYFEKIVPPTAATADQPGGTK